MTPPSSGLKPLPSALEALINAAKPTPHTQLIECQNALGKVLARDLLSTVDVPPEDNSAVDGYALRHSHVSSGSDIAVDQRIQAGDTPNVHTPGLADRIFTGATIPSGADTVIMQEDCERIGNAIRFDQSLDANQNIRKRGQDVKAGERVLTRGQVMTPARMGLAASVGIKTLEVFKPLKVAILSTGDELAEPGSECKPGQIYNSNRYTLHGLLNALGMEVLDLGRIPDDPALTLSAVKQASAEADAIITTGGASVGEADYVQETIQSLGELHFWRLAIKPGKPFMFGQVNSKPILGLPGNPSAVLVTFMILVRPFLLTMQGCTTSLPTPRQVPINFDIRRPGKRREFLRVRVNDNGMLEQHPNQSSGMLSSASWAEGLAEIPEGTAPKEGDTVRYHAFTDLLYMPH